MVLGFDLPFGKSRIVDGIRLSVSFRFEASIIWASFVTRSPFELAELEISRITPVLELFLVSFSSIFVEGREGFERELQFWLSEHKSTPTHDHLEIGALFKTSPWKDPFLVTNSDSLSRIDGEKIEDSQS